MLSLFFDFMFWDIFLPLPLPLFLTHTRTHAISSLSLSLSLSLFLSLVHPYPHTYACTSCRGQGAKGLAVFNSIPGTIDNITASARASVSKEIAKFQVHKNIFFSLTFIYIYMCVCVFLFFHPIYVCIHLSHVSGIFIHLYLL